RNRGPPPAADGWGPTPRPAPGPRGQSESSRVVSLRGSGDILRPRAAGGHLPQALLDPLPVAAAPEHLPAAAALPELLRPGATPWRHPFPDLVPRHVDQ